MGNKHFDERQFIFESKIPWTDAINYAVFRFTIPNNRAQFFESELSVEYWEGHVRIVLDNRYIIYRSTEDPSTIKKFTFSAEDVNEPIAEWDSISMELYYDDDAAGIACILIVNDQIFACDSSEMCITATDTWSYKQHTLEPIPYSNYRRFIHDNDVNLNMAESSDTVPCLYIAAQYEGTEVLQCLSVAYADARRGNLDVSKSAKVNISISDIISKIVKHTLAILNPAVLKPFFKLTNDNFYARFETPGTNSAAEDTLEAAQHNYAKYHKANAEASISGKADLFTLVSLHQGNTVAKLKYLGTRTKYADKPLVITCLSLVASIVLDKSMALSNPNALLPFFLNTDSDFYDKLPDYRLKDEADLEEDNEDDAPSDPYHAEDDEEEDIDDAINYHTSHFEDSSDDTPPYVWRIYQYTAAGADIEVWIGDGWAKLYVDAVKVDEGSSDSGCITLMTGIKSRRLYVVVDKFDYDNLQAHVSVRYDGCSVPQKCMKSEVELHEDLHI